MRRIAHCLIVLALLVACTAPAARAEAIKIGLLKTSSSAVTAIAIKRGYFTAEGSDAQLVPFLKNAAGAEKIVDKRFVVPMTPGQRGGAAH